MISSSQSGKHLVRYQVQEDFSKKKKKFDNKTNTFHSKYCKFVWKYYRVTKKKEFHLAVNLEIVNEISRYQIASKELFFLYFFYRKQEGFIIWL